MLSDSSLSITGLGLLLVSSWYNKSGRLKSPKIQK